MRPHRLYRLHPRVPVGDLFVGLVAASLGFEALKVVMDERLALPLCALVGGGAFLLWTSVKRLLPRNFVPDVVDWILQPAVYRATRDTRTPPLIVEPEPNGEGESRDAAHRIAH